MGRFAAAILVVSVLALQGIAAPIMPIITDHDFSFLVGPNSHYFFNGSEPDRLLVAPAGFGGDHDVFTYTTPVLPVPGPSIPVYDMLNTSEFGGTMYLNIIFTGSDGPYIDPVTGKSIDVSLTGTGGSYGDDLEIWGYLPGLSGSPWGILLGMEITEASLYGYSGRGAYNVEAIGRITYSAIPALRVGGQFGQLAAVTGTMFGPVLPHLYSPNEIRWDIADMAYSGEVGVPEPATYLLALLGGAFAVAMRKKRAC
jgi:hypothetical protein